MQPVLKTNIQKDNEDNFLNAGALHFDVLITECKTKLSLHGWTVIKDVGQDHRVRAILAELGGLLPQYTGELTYEVKALPGFENYQYSQSANTIQPHTEAPVYTPPPKYLALHCLRQARCGAGQTLLADGFRFIQSLPAELRLEAMTRKLNFSGYRTPEAGAAKAPAALKQVMSLGPDGAPILRFSYNIFCYDNLHPTLGMPCRDDYQGDDDFLRQMSERGLAFFESENIGVLIPDDAVLIFDNHRMLHARSAYQDKARHLIRYWVGNKASVVADGVEE